MFGRLSASLIFTTTVFLVTGTSARARDCAFWGEFGSTAWGNYQARLDAGQSPDEALEKTHENMGFGDSEPGMMGHVFSQAIIAALSDGQGKAELYRVAEQVCLSYPEGEFDPDSLG